MVKDQVGAKWAEWLLRVVISNASNVCVAFTDVGRIASLMREFIRNRKRQWYPKVPLQHPKRLD